MKGHKLDNKAIETLSVNAVRDSIVTTEHLDQFIPDNDKEPSWDGAVYIYNDKSKKKDKLTGRLPVQVKGKEYDDLSKEEISFPVSTVDLKNYLNDGGVIFFVVYIGYLTTQKQIYYAELTPIKIRLLLSEAKEQKTKSIKLKKFPKATKQKEMIFLNCWNNCQKQKSFSTSELLSLEELKEKGVLDGISIPIATVEGVDAGTALLTNEVYIYAKIKGTDILQPIEEIPQNITRMEERPARITVGERLFYEKITISYNADGIITRFGESFSIIYDKKGKTTIKYTDSTHLRAYVTDLDFILSFLKEGEFSYNGVSFPFDVTNANFSNFSIDENTKRLEYFKKVVTMLDILGCGKDIDFNTLKEADWKNISILVTALVDKKEVSNLKENLPSVMNMKIGDLSFKVFMVENEDNKGTYHISDYFKTNLLLFYKNKHDEDVPISKYVILRANDFVNVDNISLEELLPSFQRVERHNETIEKANYLLLELLLAYDECNRKDIINTAKALSDWIMDASEEELPYDIRLINKLQIEKRLRSLENSEKEALFQITEKPDAPESVKVGAYLLLDQQAMAERHFERIDKDMQDDFKTYPIYHFWNQE